MHSADRLFEQHRSVFDRDEFQWPDTEARICFALQDTGASWLALTEEGRLVLRSSRSGDLEPHVTVTFDSSAFERHMAGELDLIESLRPSDYAFAADDAGPRPNREELQFLSARILGTLSLASHCNPRFRGTEIERLYLANRSQREDGGFQPMGSWSLPYYAGEILYDLVTRERLGRTLEVGMAHALSTLFIAEAHRTNGGGQHVAIDPWQSGEFSRSGIMNVRRAGLEDLVTVVEEPNYVALPRLLETGAGSFQLVFIDGLHIFDHVLLDFFYSDLLLAVGGYVVFDDSNLVGVHSALNFIAENRCDSYEQVLHRGRITVLRKTAEDLRVDRYGVLFHRHFRSEGELTPVAPPPSPRFVKHAFDRGVALVAVLALMPLAVGFSLAIVLEDLMAGRGLSSPFRREPMYSAGQRFDLVRFRTSGPEGPTRVGALLRRLHLHVLPTFWNVLCGRMSLVGPNPIPPHDRERLALFGQCGMRAGLTGLHRLVQGRPQYNEGNEYYFEYTRRSHLSLLVFDLKVLLWTLGATLRGGSSVASDEPGP